MFKKLVLSGAVASLLATGAMAEGYTTDIYTSIGSQGSYEFGLAMDHKNNISSSWSYKNIADKDLYKGAIYAANKINDVYWGVGAGVIHSKMNETKELFGKLFEKGNAINRMAQESEIINVEVYESSKVLN